MDEGGVMAFDSDRQLLIEAYWIIKKVQGGDVDTQAISHWLDKVEEESPDIARPAADFDPEAEEYAWEVDREEIGT
jgi:hypothetical protein